MVFVTGDASEDHDQELENFEMELNSTGMQQFNISAQAPNLNNLPTKEDIFETSCLVIQGNFMSQEFFRCSFYMTHLYPDNPDEKSFYDLNKMRRVIPKKSPQVLNFDINWYDNPSASLLFQPDDEELTRIKQANVDLFNGMSNPFGGASGSLFGGSQVNNKENMSGGFQGGVSKGGVNTGMFMNNGAGLGEQLIDIGGGNDIEGLEEEFL